MMIKRGLTVKIKELAKKYPVVTVTGPRQSGKSTLLKENFKEYKYLNLEDLTLRQYAIDDPKGFLLANRRAIIDEAQYAPDLFSYIQVITDESNSVGEYILSGSQNFLLMKNISQSLAGRSGLTRLLPLSVAELNSAKINYKSTENLIYTGFYPRIYDKAINPTEFYEDYLATYLDKDVNELLSVRNIAVFNKFLRLCAARVGRLLNYTELSKDAGIDIATVKSWLSILEASYITYTLQPYYANIGKRLIKSPKLYFYDVGLACYLLGIKNTENMPMNSHYGGLFENLSVGEIIKGYHNRKITPDLYFYRDNNGNEVDLLDMTAAGRQKAYEIKSGRTAKKEHSVVLNGIADILDIKKENRIVIYDGEHKANINGAAYVPLNILADETDETKE